MTRDQIEWPLLLCPVLGGVPLINILSFIAVYTVFKAAKTHTLTQT